MTITVTVEELRAHEERAIKWSSDRADALASAYVLFRHKIVGHEDRFQAEPPHPAVLAKFDAEKPFPKLLPSI